MGSDHFCDAGTYLGAVEKPTTSPANETQAIQRRGHRLLMALADHDGIDFDNIPMDLAAEVRQLVTEARKRRARRGGNRRPHSGAADT